jgi:hypothetical protein
MDDMTSEPLPIACTLTPAEGVTRMQRWQWLRDAAQREAIRTDEGVEVTYRRSDDVARELQELVEAERECCAFASWHVEEQGNDVVLRVLARSEADRAAVAGLGTAFGA